MQVRLSSVKTGKLSSKARRLIYFVLVAVCIFLLYKGVPYTRQPHIVTSTSAVNNYYAQLSNTEKFCPMGKYDANLYNEGEGNILFAINTPSFKFNKRLAFRNTWVSYARRIPNVDAVFFTMNPKNRSLDIMLADERNACGDIVHMDYVSDEITLALTVKIMELLTYLYKNAKKKYKWIFISDDDTYINVVPFVKFLDKHYDPDKYFLVGKMLPSERFFSVPEYNFSYPAGLGYGISTNLLETYATVRYPGYTLDGSFGVCDDALMSLTLLHAGIYDKVNLIHMSNRLVADIEKGTFDYDRDSHDYGPEVLLFHRLKNMADYYYIASKYTESGPLSAIYDREPK